MAYKTNDMKQLVDKLVKGGLPIERGLALLRAVDYVLDIRVQKQLPEEWKFEIQHGFESFNTLVDMTNEYFL